MKNLKLLLSLLFSAFLIEVSQAQKTDNAKETYFWSDGKKYLLDIDSTRIILHPKKKLNAKDDSDKFSKKENVKQSSYILESGEIIIDFKEKNKKHLDVLKAEITDYEVSFNYKYGKGVNLLPTGILALLPKNRVSIDEIQKRFNSKIEWIGIPRNGYYTIKPKKNEELLQLGNEIFESGMAAWCHPDFSVPIKRHSVPSDPLYTNQYYLKPNSSNSNYHINVEKAWDITKGANTVKMAIVDDGIEAHEDLPNLMSGRSIELNFTTYQPSESCCGEPDDSEEVLYSGFNGELGHGQAIAGIVNAKHNNDKGIAGIAPNIQILPINVFTFTVSLPNGQRAWFIRYSSLAMAINYAKNQNCDIISFSIGDFDNEIGQSLPNISLLNTAISNAVYDGRNSKGMVIVSAIGNGGPLTQPAANSLIIGVGAVNQYGQIPKYVTISDNIDLFSPSSDYDLINNRIIYDFQTIDREENGTGIKKGYDWGNYTTDFGGTSAAAPQVAAVAALMLSVNPNLTATQVESIMKNTGRSHLGYASACGGCLDLSSRKVVQACEAVFEAVNMAVGISGNVINGSGTISLAGLPTTLSNASNVSWVVTGGLVTPSSGTGVNANLSATGSGNASITFTVNHNCGATVSFTKSTSLSVTSSPPPPSNSLCQNLANKCYKIKPVNITNGLILEVAGGGTVGGESIWQNYANNCGNQVYKVEQTDESQYCKITAQYPGGRSWQMSAAGGVNEVTIGAEVKNIDYNGNNSQKFFFSDAGGSTYHLSTKAVIDAFGGTKTQYHYVDVFGGNSNQFNKLSLWYRNGGDNQRFVFEETGCATSCSGNGGTGGGGNTCGMSIASVGYNCNSNILEAVTVNGDGGAELQYRADAGPWYDYHFHIQFLSPGTHTFSVRKKYDTNCQASITSSICGVGGGSGGGGGACPAAGCLSIGMIGYNCNNGVLETVTVSGGSGNYQYALDNCNVWKDYQFHIQQIPNGSHTIFVRDVANTNCGDVKGMTVGCNNARQRSNEEAISSNTEENISGMEIFPNPASDEISIRFLIEKDQKAEISLMDITGKDFQKREVLGTGTTQNEKFTIKNLSAGQYFINLKTDKLNTAKKFVKE